MNWESRTDTYTLKSESVSVPSRPTLCDPMDCSPPGFSVHGLPEKILEWVSIPFFRYIHAHEYNRQLVRSCRIEQRAQGSEMTWRGEMGPGWEGGSRGRRFM